MEISRPLLKVVRVTAVLVTAVLTGTAAPTPQTSAAPNTTPQPWNGRYRLITYATQKAGTSPAARQRESDFDAVFTLTTTCTFDHCVATATDGPAPANATVPQPARYMWNGTGWASSYDWLWDCSVGSSGQRQWAHATSFAVYVPQSDGSLRGTWQTDISEGACHGSVLMPVAAFPA